MFQSQTENTAHMGFTSNDLAQSLDDLPLKEQGQKTNSGVKGKFWNYILEYVIT